MRDIRPEIMNHTEKVMVRLLGVNWMCTECSVESTLRVAGYVDLTVGETV